MADSLIELGQDEIVKSILSKIEVPEVVQKQLGMGADTKHSTSSPEHVEPHTKYVSPRCDDDSTRTSPRPTATNYTIEQLESEVTAIKKLEKVLRLMRTSKEKSIKLLNQRKRSPRRNASASNQSSKTATPRQSTSDTTSTSTSTSYTSPTITNDQSTTNSVANIATTGTPTIVLSSNAISMDRTSDVNTHQSNGNSAAVGKSDNDGFYLNQTSQHNSNGIREHRAYTNNIHQDASLVETNSCASEPRSARPSGRGRKKLTHDNRMATGGHVRGNSNTSMDSSFQTNRFMDLFRESNQGTGSIPSDEFDARVSRLAVLSSADRQQLVNEVLNALHLREHGVPTHGMPQPPQNYIDHANAPYRPDAKPIQHQPPQSSQLPPPHSRNPPLPGSGDGSNGFRFRPYSTDRITSSPTSTNSQYMLPSTSERIVAPPGYELGLPAAAAGSDMWNQNHNNQNLGTSSGTWDPMWPLDRSHASSFGPPSQQLSPSTAWNFDGSTNNTMVSPQWSHDIAHPPLVQPGVESTNESSQDPAALAIKGQGGKVVLMPRLNLHGVRQSSVQSESNDKSNVRSQRVETDISEGAWTSLSLDRSIQDSVPLPQDQSRWDVASSPRAEMNRAMSSSTGRASTAHSARSDDTFANMADLGGGFSSMYGLGLDLSNSTLGLHETDHTNHSRTTENTSQSNVGETSTRQGFSALSTLSADSYAFRPQTARGHASNRVQVSRPIQSARHSHENGRLS